MRLDKSKKYYAIVHNRYSGIFPRVIEIRLRKLNPSSKNRAEAFINNEHKSICIYKSEEVYIMCKEPRIFVFYPSVGDTLYLFEGNRRLATTFLNMHKDYKFSLQNRL